jgi:magnesium chelatase family protein
MLARRLTTILPTMNPGEGTETIRIHSVAGLTGERTVVVTTRPCHAPHHTISDVGLVGGGHVPMPSEVSRAHHGMLLRDALPSFRCRRLEELHQPLVMRLRGIVGVLIACSTAPCAAMAYCTLLDMCPQGEAEIRERSRTRVNLEDQRPHRLRLMPGRGYRR